MAATKSRHKPDSNVRQEAQPGSRQASGNRGRQKDTIASVKPESGPLSEVTDHGANLDRLIHEKTRLAIISALAANTHLSFNDLKSLLKISDGNLSTHARKLEDAGYVNCKKDYDGRIPRTRYTLSASGRKALNKYVGHMEALIKAVKDSG